MGSGAPGILRRAGRQIAIAWNAGPAAPSRPDRL